MGRVQNRMRPFSMQKRKEEYDEEIIYSRIRNRRTPGQSV